MPLYTHKSVSFHDKRDDCWIIIHSKVYEVTDWLKKHPGGQDIIFNYAGQDTTVNVVGMRDTALLACISIS